MMKNSRQDVYKAIDEERNYQDSKWDTSNRIKPTECYLVYMESYLRDAIHAISHSAGDTSALDIIRKVTALGVACMEDNEIIKRKL